MNHTDVHTFVKSRAFVWLLSGIGFLIILIAVFEAGMFVGFHKASFARDWEENYGRNFGTPPGAFPMMAARGGANPHGATGQIVDITLPSFIIANPSGDEQSVRIATSTLIRKGMLTADEDDLSVGQYAVVIGQPDASGTLEASFVRLMPLPIQTR
jgi:hypothetical protein